MATGRVLPAVAAPALLGVLLCLSTGCATAVCDDAWFGPDKTMHFAASFAIGAGAAAVAGSDGREPESAAAAGLGAAAVVGAGKETFDLGVEHTCWSWKDFAWDILGGALGAAAGVAATSSGD